MLDIKYIRKNPDTVKEAAQNKNEKVNIDYILELDEKKRKTQFEFDKLRAEQNKVSKQIPVLKKEKKDISGILQRMKEISEQVKKLSTDVSMLEEKLKQELLKVPNIPHADVPIGKDEKSNRLIRQWGGKKQSEFELRDHMYLAESLKYLDFKRASKLSGSGFAAYIATGARLERALINFMLDYHIKNHNYKEISLPFIVDRTTMIGTGQLPKLENDMYHIEQDDLFLIPTAEVPVTNFYRGEIISYKDIPEKFVSYSPCFRREAGSYGKDTKGLQRLHQFNKVEIVRLVHPDQSDQALEEMLQDAEDIVKALGLHYRVVELATGDLSFASAKTYDIEVWAPGSQKYLEVSSISNFVDFQARRASLRFRDQDEKIKYLHTLNGSGLATPRTLIAILETYQLKDGRVKIPEMLEPYLR
ncbi:MAG: serine--tRNA ligase [Candidatus Cloacimonadota bacterium]|nr:serine--tRNA ligase [Candidatus Cloacimonadota bacterium]